jgi:very-short-patch-repair endonuclease
MPSSHLSPDLSAVFAAQHALITREQAERCGLTRGMVVRRMAAGLLDEPAPGVRLVGAPGTWEQRVMGVTLSSGGRAVASHRCAAALHGMDGFSRSMVEVSVARPGRLRRVDSIVHQTQTLAQQDLTTVAGIPVTGVARTLADLGSVVEPLLVERGLDDVRRRGLSLRWVQATAERLHRPGQAGTGVLLDLLEAAWAEPTVRGSWFERLVEACLRSPQLPPLVRQHRVYDGSGRLVGILDLAFPTLRLGVEAHSRRFHFGRLPEQADEDRDHRLARCGWEVLYVGWQSTKRPAELLALVVETAKHRRTLVA